MMIKILDELDGHVRDNYGLKNFSSIQEDEKIFYFTEWGAPFLEFRIYRNNIEVLELFSKVPGSIAIRKKVG